MSAEDDMEVPFAASWPSSNLSPWRLLPPMAIGIALSAALIAALGGMPLLRFGSIYFVALFVSATLSAFVTRLSPSGRQLAGLCFSSLLLFLLYCRQADYSLAVDQFFNPALRNLYGTWIGTELFLGQDYKLLESQSILIMVAFPFSTGVITLCLNGIAGIYMGVSRNIYKIQLKKEIQYDFLIEKIPFIYGKTYANLPWLNNATVAHAAGWVAIIFPLASIDFILALINQTSAGSGWSWVPDHAGLSYWYPALLPVLYFGFLAQKRTAEAVRIAAEAPPFIPVESPSVKPVYDAFVEAADLAASIRYGGWSASDTGKSMREPRIWREMLADRQRRFRGDVDALLRGETLFRPGNADAEMLSMLSTAISRYQDRGQTTLVICPDGCSGRLNALLGQSNRIEFPEIARVIGEWRADETRSVDIDPFLILDVLVAEESAFSSVVVGDVSETRQRLLDNLFHRIGLIVLVDFHAIDASRLRFTLEGIGRYRMRQTVGLFVQMRSRFGDSDQLLVLRRQLPKAPSNNIIYASPTSFPRDHGMIWLRSSRALRAGLANFYGVPDIGLNHPTETYFALNPQSGSEAQKPFPTLIVQNSGDPCPLSSDEDRNGTSPFEIEIRAVYGHGGGGRKILRECDASPCGFSRQASRIVVVSDPGNAEDVLDAGNVFRPREGDGLTVLVSQGYPGLSYLEDRLDPGGVLHDRDYRRRMWQPMAQQLGIGITDVANRLARLLSRPEGVEQDEVVRVLGMASGSMRNFLDVSATGSGLKTLFELIQPGRPIQIDVEWNALQKVRLKTPRGTSAVIAEEVSWVVEEGAHSDRIVRVPTADEGLLFCVDRPFRLGRQMLRFERNSTRRDGLITVTRLSERDAVMASGLYPFPRHYFERDYTLLATAAGGTGLAFVGENIGNPLDKAMRCWFGLVHITVERCSTGIMSISSDIEPLVDMGVVRRDRLSSVVRHRRPFLCTEIIAFADDDGRFADDAVLRATLAATLQVVVGMAFPALRERLAVVSLDDVVCAGRSRHDEVSCLFPTGRIDGCSVSSLLSTLREKLDGDAGSMGGHRPSSLAIGDDLIAFAVIEDADHDLGVSRRIHDSMQLILERWHDFLSWAAERPEWNVEGVFDARRAADFPGFADRERGQ